MTKLNYFPAIVPGQVVGYIYAGYVLLASQSPNPIIIYSVADYRPYVISRFFANSLFSRFQFISLLYTKWKALYFSPTAQTFWLPLLTLNISYPIHPLLYEWHCCPFYQIIILSRSSVLTKMLKLNVLFVFYAVMITYH